MTSAAFERTVVWRNLFLEGSDCCSLWKNSEGWILEGTAIAVLGGNRPLIARYEVCCDRGWRTRRVRVERTIGSDVRDLHLSVGAEGVWQANGEEVSTLSGLIDVDLAATPATNTLPIRRLNLGIGQSAEVRAAWVQLPDLALAPLAQTYTRVSADSFRYQSATGFTAEITVDELGLVKTYAGAWVRLGQL